MHGEAPPPFDGEEAGVATKTTWKMICIYMYIWIWYIDTYEYWDIPCRTVRGNPGHTSLVTNWGGKGVCRGDPYFRGS